MHVYITMHCDTIRENESCLPWTHKTKEEMLKSKDQRILVLSNYVTVFERCTYVHIRQTITSCRSRIDLCNKLNQPCSIHVKFA